MEMSDEISKGTLWNFVFRLANFFHDLETFIK